MPGRSAEERHMEPGTIETENKGKGQGKKANHRTMILSSRNSIVCAHFARDCKAPVKAARCDDGRRKLKRRAAK